MVEEGSDSPWDVVLRTLTRTLATSHPLSSLNYLRELGSRGSTTRGVAVETGPGPRDRKVRVVFDPVTVYVSNPTNYEEVTLRCPRWVVRPSGQTSTLVE